MSWLSDRLGTTGKTPALIKSIGNVAGGAIAAALPFGLGGAVDKVFNMSGSQPQQSLQDLARQTGDNLNDQLNRAGQMNQATAFLQSPAGIVLMLGAAYLLLRDRK